MMTNTSKTTLLALVATLLMVGTVDAQGVPGVTYDDGYVTFSLDNYDDTVDGVRVDQGWGLSATARVVGDIPRRSAFIFKISQGDTELGQVRCTLESELHNVVTPWHGVSDCEDRDQRITVAGEVNVSVVLVNGDTDEETVVASHRLQILQATRVRSSGQPNSTRHYINHNGEVLRGIISRIPERVSGYIGGRRSGSSNRVGLHIMAAPSEYNRLGESSLSMSDPRELSLRCSVDGTRLPIERDQVAGGMSTIENVNHVFGEARREDQIVMHYRRISYILPIEWGSRRLGRMPALEEHPGRWECMIRNAGQVVRTIAFTVNPDGTFAPHAEEAAGFTLTQDAHLVDVTVPDSEVFETRVDPDSVRRMGIGYGHVLTSAPSLANIEALPTLGDAFLPQPAPARASRRGRRGRRGRR